MASLDGHLSQGRAFQPGRDLLQDDPSPGDLVILVRPPGADDQRYPNRWSASRLDVRATHQQVVNAIERSLASGRPRVF